ncbi:hypothetical protein [Pelomicrobium sp. G1]|uniref:hypothetical protein n=1 Tax=unclassified Pelomicrobium TaxID=2815318 RepID=UPI003F767F82
MTKGMKLVNAFLAAAAVSALAMPVRAAEGEGDRYSLAFRQSITDGSPYGTDIKAGMERKRGVEGRAGIEAPEALDPRAREFQRQLSASDGESLGL